MTASWHFHPFSFFSLEGRGRPLVDNLTEVNLRTRYPQLLMLKSRILFIWSFGYKICQVMFSSGNLQEGQQEVNQTEINSIREQGFENDARRLVHAIKTGFLRPNALNVNRTKISKNILPLQNFVDLIDCKENSQKMWMFQSPGENFPGYACDIRKTGSAKSFSFVDNLAPKLEKAGCSGKKNCSSHNCDPYLSVFETPKNCSIGTSFRNLKKPNLAEWKSDKQFSLNFIQGVNPLTIRKVRSMSEVHEDLQNLEVEIDGEVLSVAQILKKQKLFLADYSELDSIQLNNNSVFYSPQVLLSLDKFGDLDIISILLRTNKQTKSHVLTKASPKNRLLFAKMHVANADAQIHEFPSHMKIHFVMEAIAVGVHNFLSGHLLGRLLEPHVKGTIFMNIIVRSLLGNQNNSFFEKAFSVGRNGALKLISENFRNVFNFEEAAFPRMMAERGFPQDESDGVTDYYYRRDGFKLWDILLKYADGVVDKIYKDDLEVEKDEALKQFTQSMSDENQGNIPGFPQHIKTKEVLTETLTNIIFTGSVQHQALNAPHYLYSYAPHRPTFLAKWMPDEGKELSWAWIKTALPTLKQVEELYIIAMILSTQSPCTLIDLDVFQDEFPDIQNELTKGLKKLSDEIESRNSDYDYLHPAKVACSVDI